MSKYIIKNCPAIYGVSLDGCKKDHYEDGAVLCQDCTDCVMKQIVEKCNKIIFLNGGTDFTDVDMYKHSVGENFVARKILKLLDIQEVA